MKAPDEGRAACPFGRYRTYAGWALRCSCLAAASLSPSSGKEHPTTASTCFSTFKLSSEDRYRTSPRLLLLLWIDHLNTVIVAVGPRFPPATLRCTTYVCPASRPPDREDPGRNRTSLTLLCEPLPLGFRRDEKRREENWPYPKRLPLGMARVVSRPPPIKPALTSLTHPCSRHVS